ncbi:hypothetical protein Phum_PHUM123490 [Pediculus humanus corporis]|uniref:Uncharacterized protein n=1 Tax=Pediculus humanus subsp. corporis TaxID=121224 RepID=E0VDR1_PEDHC|nr:uncharacterized protein Phum_PHUM123490 [Pediculus humanus corporis]EEB11517.1 hypothetical protein Phum_PHUM123490 [Pediculus humanus corporis]
MIPFALRNIKIIIYHGHYAAKNFPINLKILPDWVENGFYKVKITVMKEKTRLLCLELSETLKFKKLTDKTKKNNG